MQRLVQSVVRPLPRLSLLTQTRGLSSAPFLRPRKVIDQLNDAELKGKRVFVRVDFNVPQDKKTLAITDDTRIKEALPTINYLRSKGAKVILASHLGRPKDGKADPKFSLKPCADRLSKFLGAPVTFTKSAIGDQTKAQVSRMKNGDVLLLENARFLAGEEKNDVKTIRQFCETTGAEVYVNDAFGTAHRAHATTAGVKPWIKMMTKNAAPAVAGFLMAKEIKFLFPLVTAPEKPFVAIIGGAKIDTKIGVIKSLLNKCDKVLLGGAMIFPFYKAKGLSVGAQKVDADAVEIAKDIMQTAEAKGVELVLPVDLICADAFKPDANTQEAAADSMPAGWLGLDIGPKSVALFEEALKDAKTIFWNGPMGVFEFEKFAAGTVGVAKIMASKTDAVTVIGGGDSVSAVQQVGVADKISHISTGGGASLELLEGAVLPGIDVLDDPQTTSCRC